jgi:hypothetical protein
MLKPLSLLAAIVVAWRKAKDELDVFDRKGRGQ